MRRITRLVQVRGLVINNMFIHIRNHNDQGFTVVESLIALVLLGIIVIGGAAFYFQASALYYTGLRARMAASIASSRIEYCKGLGYANLPTPSGGLCPAAASPVAVQVGSVSGSSAVTSNGVTITESGVGNVTYQLVVAAVSWIDPVKGAQAVTVQTYVGP